MHENTWERVTILVNLMFRRLDKFDGPIFGEGGGIYGGFIFGLLIGLHIRGRGRIFGGRIKGILRYIAFKYFSKYYINNSLMN